MPKTVSIVNARRDLGRLAEEVRRTRQPVILTKRGRVVACIAPEPRRTVSPRRRPDPFGALRGTVELVGSFNDLQRTVRSLRQEFSASLDRRAGLSARPTKRNA